MRSHQEQVGAERREGEGRGEPRELRCLGEALAHVARDFDADVDPSLTWSPRYNVAPTQPVLVLGARDGRRVLRALRWGLVPSWAKDVSIGAQCINARSETLATKPAFRAAYAKRRGAVLVTGWFEWRAGAVKVPHWFHDAEGAILALAAVWEAWRDPTTGEELRTCAILTRAAGPLVATVHDRYFIGNVRQIQRFFDRSVAAANDCDILTAIEKAVASSTT